MQLLFIKKDTVENGFFANSTWKDEVKREMSRH